MAPCIKNFAKFQRFPLISVLAELLNPEDHTVPLLKFLYLDTTREKLFLETLEVSKFSNWNHLLPKMEYLLYALRSWGIRVFQTEPTWTIKSCLQIMFFMGIVDVLCLPIVGLLHGYLGVIGAVFCTTPDLIYITGCVSMGLWACEGMAATLLAVDRCLEIAMPKLGNVMFKYVLEYWV